MRSLGVALSFVSLAVLALACGSEDAAPLQDAGASDATSPGDDATTSDASVAPDGQVAPDATETDASDHPDATPMVDVGFAPDAEPAVDVGPQDASTRATPLVDLTQGNYLGYPGGLYPNRSNVPPTAHFDEAIRRANAVQPLDGAGNPAAIGKLILLSIGLSNTTQEWCSGTAMPPCTPQSFMTQAASDPAVDHTRLTILNGAFGARPATAWDAPDDPDYDRVRDTVLQPNGATEAQVQLVWLKTANPNPTIGLPDRRADAFALEASIGAILRTLKVRFPNLQMVFISSRIYGGYATSMLNPEPYAYESGFAVKWAIEAQIAQMAGAPADSRAGDLDYRTVAPWIGWAAYLWADGTTPRSDGLTWVQSDMQNDGTHPAASGVQKVAGQLMGFFRDSPYTRCWFIIGASCP